MATEMHVLTNSYNGHRLVRYITPPFESVTIGTQTWTAKNLAIDDGGTGIYTRVCDYGQGEITEYYYTLEAAIRIVNNISGWHLPSKDEFDTLAATVGGLNVACNKLKSTYGWEQPDEGTDDYDFTALPAGEWSGSFYDFGWSAYFWTTTLYSTNIAYFCQLYRATAKMKYNTSSIKYPAYSVRLIKDV